MAMSRNKPAEAPPDQHAAEQDEGSRSSGLPQRPEALIQAARSAWPELEVPPDAFAAHLESRLQRLSSTAGRRVRRHVADLYLAYACAHGEPRAVAAFHKQYRPKVEVVLRRMGLDAAAIGEVLQIVSEKLLVRRGDRPPMIGQYSGQGSLRSWVRVTAANAALNWITRGPKEKPADEAYLEALQAPTDDPELALLKQVYQGEFKSAFRAAWSQLAPRDQTLLQLRFIEALSIERLYRIYRVHRTTIDRWLARAKQRLLDETRRELTERLGLATAEFDSIMRLIDSRLDFTIRSLPGSSVGAAPVPRGSRR